MAAQELAFGPNGAGALPILRSAFVVCDHDARLAGLPHVGEIISKCLDWSGHWTLQSASEHALPYLVHRLALNACSTAYVDAECDRCLSLQLATAFFQKWLSSTGCFLT
ncbi:hypothetical protein PF005_g8595 [Phytophthora fragariae]|uniref:Uncharacterized protein n=1 Tax=Phytophthora fragariae TaxID=53985 RepID=A0A6A4DIM2_9STRA|nr:hypothetical protein PF009_g8566 [Phytophthora fragariae]KAE9105465.1 hypothetical protein PF010_g13012 [Phytophthora fragariae]KAE9110345.1 hypothetical protein PF007_g11891 [Phytophthora fragariae]KAE9147508.1 hypothetical protein PF006_g7823 [Phytophthora fragariae]KAE9217587.1 hypothetical protein PF005_g8595 [Phytophthora fragariae]